MENIYEKHIFVCINERSDGRKSCGLEVGMALIEKFKKLQNEAKLPLKIRAQKAGCFDTCGFGPMVIIYPEGIFYKNVSIDDVDEIFESHVKNNKIVARLVLNKA